MKKKSPSLAERLNGRFALTESTGSANREAARCALADRHGPRLAALVESGNQDAIALVGLYRQRDAVRAGRPELVIHEGVENRIATLRAKLQLEADTGNELALLLQTAASAASFQSRQHFRQNLCEGLQLQINTLAANQLAVPAGAYVVWTTDAGTTMLVPQTDAVRSSDILADSKTPNYEIATSRLLGCWNKVERVLQERRKFKTDTSGEEGDAREPRTKKSHQGLPDLRRDREQAGMSLADAAEATGLAVPTIAKHELGYANPSNDSMKRMLDAYHADPGDFFKQGPVQPYETFATGSSDGGGESDEKPRRPAPKQERDED